MDSLVGLTANGRRDTVRNRKGHEKTGVMQHKARNTRNHQELEEEGKILHVSL